MRILTQNILENNSGITMTNQDANYDPKSIYSSILEDVVKAIDSSATITLTFDDIQSVDSIYFGWHNCSSLTFTFKDSLGNILYTKSFDEPLLYNKSYFDQVNNISSITIDLASTDLVFIGNISCGNYTQLYNILRPLVITYHDTTQYEQTTGGQVLFNSGTLLKTFNVSMQKITIDQFNSFLVAYSEIKKGKPFWLDRYEDQSLSEPIFGFITTDIQSQENYGTITTQFTFMEAK